MVTQPDRRARRAVARGIREHGSRSPVEVSEAALGDLPRPSRAAVQASAEEGRVSKSQDEQGDGPANGPATPADGRVRLEEAHQKFDEACRQLASHGRPMRTTLFGTVPVEDYVRFTELHTRHHGKQMPERR
jgi:hypothetical protein